MWSGLCVSVCNRPTSDAHKNWSCKSENRTLSGAGVTKVSLKDSYKSSWKPASRTSPDSAPLFPGGVFCFNLFCTWVTSMWGNRTKWNERDAWGKIFLEGWVYLGSPQSLSCGAVTFPPFTLEPSKTSSLGFVVLIAPQGTQQRGPGMDGGQELLYRAGSSTNWILFTTKDYLSFLALLTPYKHELTSISQSSLPTAPWLSFSVGDFLVAFNFLS